jgi:hypothetical protein
VVRQILVRTHGGLGNQLFQILFARLLARSKGGIGVARIHADGYAHRFPASLVFKNLQTPSVVAAAISACRVPKALRRMKIRSSEWIALPGMLVLDGYFQEAQDYSIFDEREINTEIQELRQELSISKLGAGGDLVHIRLGDFFADEQAQREYLTLRVSDIPKGADIITNREDLLEASPICQHLIRNDNRLRSTSALEADELLRLMASYSRIHANDSTLALWAALLGGAEINLTEPRLNALRKKLTVS